MDTTLVENDDGKVEYQTEARTVAEQQLFIATTPTGLYQIVAKGPGAPLGLSDEKFTSLKHAKDAIANYLRINQSTINKKRIQTAAIERRKKENAER